MIELVVVQNITTAGCAGLPAFSFADGGRYALIGPNGSGKTTLLRILAERSSRTRNCTLRKHPEKAKSAYLPQKPYAFDRRCWKRLLALETAGGEKKRLAALERVDLGHLAKTRETAIRRREDPAHGAGETVATRRYCCSTTDVVCDIQANDKWKSIAEYAERNGRTLIFCPLRRRRRFSLANSPLALDCGRLENSDGGADAATTRGRKVRASFCALRI
jgi:hypothetical protein